jgi:hypothetical protein
LSAFAILFGHVCLGRRKVSPTEATAVVVVVVLLGVGVKQYHWALHYL